MYYRQRQKRKNILVIGLILLVSSYFIYHAISGQKGLIKLKEMRSEFTHRQIELDLKRSQRLEIEHKVNLLRSESLDLDLLEEQVRKNLGLSKKGERIYDLSKMQK